MKTIKITPFEASELQYKVEVLIDSGSEMWEDIKFTEDELEALDSKIVKGNNEFSDKEFNLLKEEAEDLLTIAETNYDGGFPEYKNDVLKLRRLIKKMNI